MTLDSNFNDIFVESENSFLKRFGISSDFHVAHFDAISMKYVPYENYLNLIELN